MSVPVKALMQGVEILAGSVPDPRAQALVTAIRLIEAATEKGEDPNAVVQTVLDKYSAVAQGIADSWAK